MSVAYQADETVAVHDALWPQRVMLMSDKLHRQFPEVLHGRVEAGTAIAQHLKRFRVIEGTWEVADLDAKQWFPVNGSCPCGDTEALEQWCKHRIAANIVQRARDIPDDDLVIDPATYDQQTGEIVEEARKPAPVQQLSPLMARPTRFAPAQRATLKLRMAITGPAGSGKSWTALALASALGERIALIDTEHGGASYYADRFAFDTLALTSFHPERYIEAIQAAATEGYEVLLIDSLSHAWMGKDGALELVDREAKRSRSSNSFAAWRDVTPLQRQLVETILAAPLHVLVTLRSKMDYVVETDQRGKQVPKKVGLAPIQREGIEYELDVVADMDLAHTLVVTKSRLYALADLVVEKPGRAFGLQIAQALR